MDTSIAQTSFDFDALINVPTESQVPAQKRCSTCKEVKPLDQFHFSKGKFAARCKVCTNVKNRERYDRNKADHEAKSIEYKDTHKCCKKCKQWLPFDRFSPSPNGKFGLAARCKSCKSEHEKSVREYRRSLNVDKKRCRKCHEMLPLDAFGPDGKSKSGLRAYCRSCCNKYHVYRPRNNRSHMLRQNYGMTLEDYDRMVEAQGGLCAICGLPETSIDSRRGLTRLLAVDHCHETGQVRALLCYACNQALGLMKENIDAIRSLTKYAEWCQSLKESASS